MAKWLFVMNLGLNHISASGHIGFGKYGGPIERLLRRPPEKNVLVYMYAKFHACRQICTIFPPWSLVQRDSLLLEDGFFN